jgi:glycosyl transferase family 87
MAPGLSWLFPENERARRRRDRALGILFLALSVLLVARAARKQGGVLETNQGFGERFLAREDPWFDPALGQRVHGPYPPSLSLVAAPLSLLPPLAARIGWSIAQVGALTLAYRLLRRRAERTWPALAPHAPAVFALALLLASRFVLRDMAGGGGNLLFGTLAYLGLELALEGRPLLAGVPLGLGLALKPNLAPLLLFFAVAGRGRREGREERGRRSYWLALLSALVCALICFWLPALYYGPARYAELAQHWMQAVIVFGALDDPSRVSAVPSGMPAAVTSMNQCLREAVLRLFQLGSGSPADLPPGIASAAAWLSRAIALALLACGAWFAGRAGASGDRRAEWLAALAFFPIALLVSPITWKAHHAALIPLFFGLVCCALDRGRFGRSLAAFLFLYWLLCDLLSEEVVESAGKEWLQAVSVLTWMDLALVGITVRAVSTFAASSGPDPARVKGAS